MQNMEENQIYKHQDGGSRDNESQIDNNLLYLRVRRRIQDGVRKKMFLLHSLLPPKETLEIICL